MDFSKIAFEASKKVVNDISEGKKSDFPVVEDEKLNELVEQNKLLMDYGCHLLEIYHNELSKELAKQGIKI